MGENKMEETAMIHLCLGEGEKTGRAPTQLVKNPSRWETRDAYSRLLVEEGHFTPDGEGLWLWDIRDGMDDVYLRDTKNAGLFSHLLGI